jgi:hypothetical protein
MDRYIISKYSNPQIDKLARVDFYTMANYIVLDPWTPDDKSFAEVMCSALNEREELKEQIVKLRDVLGRLQEINGNLYSEIRDLKDILGMK